jgi:hypothetical protein
VLSGTSGLGPLLIADLATHALALSPLIGAARELLGTCTLRADVARPRAPQDGLLDEPTPTRFDRREWGW